MKKIKSLANILIENTQFDTSIGHLNALPALAYVQKLSLGNCGEIAISSVSRFVDMEWDITEYEPTKSRSEMIITFNSLLPQNCKIGWNDRSELLHTVKLLAYSLLVDPPRSDLKLTTIVKCLKRGGIINLVRFMIANHWSKFSEITEGAMEEFLENMRTKPHSFSGIVTDRTLQVRLKGLDWIVGQSGRLLDCLTFDPMRDHNTISTWSRKNAQVVKDRHILLTPILPDKIICDLFRVSMEVICRWENLSSALEAKRMYIPNSRHPFNYQLYGFQDGFEFRRNYTHFRTAVYILISMFTGMRGDEIGYIPSDYKNACFDKDIEIKGVVQRCFFLNSKLSKNMPVRENKEWQSVPVVIDAIRKLALVNAEIEPPSPWLFRPLYFKTKNDKHQAERTLTTVALSGHLKSFVEDFEIDQNWSKKISTRNMRRTFSRLVTRNGLGIIELQDQLKHFDVNVTFMYGQPSLLEELNDEKICLSEERYEELLAGVHPIIGGGSKIVDGIRAEFKGLTRLDRKKFINSLAKNSPIDQVDLGLCMYKRELAQCGGEKANCRPADCLNSVIPMVSSLSSLENRKSENDRLLKMNKDNALYRSYLISKQLTIDELIAQANEVVNQQNGAIG